MFDPISPTYPRHTARAQLARSLGTLFATYLCTPYFLRLGAFAISPHPGVRGFPTLRLLCPSRLPAGLWSLRWGLPYLLSTLLAIPGRLSRVRHEGLKRNAVGGVFLTAPSALCGFLVVTRGRSGLPVLSVAMYAKYLATIHTTTDRLWVLVPRADISSKICQGWHAPEGDARFG
jgi:hypothetical protein